jgi:SAM-dependent methyltransferase
VAYGVRSCCQTIVGVGELESWADSCSERGLSILPLQMMGRSRNSYSNSSHRYSGSSKLESEAKEQSSYRVVMGDSHSVQEFRDEWARNNHGKLGDLLGYPSCCGEFFQRVWIREKFIDTTWPMALNSVESKDASTEYVEVTGPPQANILWRWTGLRMVPHLPCSFNCRYTVQLGIKMVELGKKIGYEQEMNWLGDILSWPVEWSALHGIAEIKNPLLKVSTRTDATPKKYVLRRKSEVLPDEAESGLLFPHLRIGGHNHKQEWYHTDNGFSSVFAMDSAHKPVVEVCLSILEANKAVNVLDLGCGNGALLKKIKNANSNVTPYGIDHDSLRIEHAHAVLPDYSENFVTGDIFENNFLWHRGLHYRISILMPGRLLDCKNIEQIKWLKNQIENHCDNLIIYAYGDWLTRYGSITKLANELGMHPLLSSPLNDKACIAKFANIDEIAQRLTYMSNEKVFEKSEDSNAYFNRIFEIGDLPTRVKKKMSSSNHTAHYDTIS